MTQRAWIGGDTDLADDPANWSPSGGPQGGDTLTMASGTMLVLGNDLVGDTLTMTGQDTAVLFNATADITTLPAPETGTETQSPAPLIDIFGHSNLLASVADGTIDLAPSAVWTGSVNAEFIPTGTGIFSEGLTVAGGRDAVFMNTSTSEIMQNVASIDVKTLGIGTFALEFGSLEFGKAVGAGQTVLVGLSGTLHLDDPGSFAGLVSLQGGFVDLAKMALADSYTYSDGVLSVFSGNTVIDTLRLTGVTPDQLEVTKAGGSLTVYQGTSPGLGALPLHI